MKKILGLFLTATAVLLVQVGFAQIAGSAHDFRLASWNNGGSGELCKVCHTPHAGDQSVSDAPLWNHAVTQTASFTLYTGSGTLNATTGQPAGVSKLCLSCHDGSVALEDFGGATGGTNFAPTYANLGTDLSNDHPISFTYNTALATADGELYDPSTDLSGLGGTINADMLFSGKMECASCHDVHNAAGNPSLLVKDNAGSALCMTCHNK